ncbi:MAG: transporter substrate-binding domain-containing protein [Burkholderiales bacterium]|jgi:polar amino acid transport system substrate-binding protein|nr:transporter substrate-binding domain-containing protein [Burkholderiales bacterium]
MNHAAPWSRFAFVALVALLVGACASVPDRPAPEVRNALAPTGKLRVGVYPGSPTSLVRDASGEARGVSVDLGRAFAERLGVPYEQVEFARLALVLEAMKAGQVDFTVTNATPARAADVDFTAPIVNLELGYLVVKGSRVNAIADVDRPGIRVGVAQGSTSQATLSRELKSATVVPAPSLQAAAQMLAKGEIDTFATNKGILSEMADSLPGSRILDGRWGLEHLAIAIPKGRNAGLPYAQKFAEEAKSTGLVQRAAGRAGLRGTVTP